MVSDKIILDKTEYYENINGNPIKLNIIKYENNILKIKIKNTKNNMFSKKLGFIISFIVIINLLLISFNVLYLIHSYLTFLIIMLLYIFNLLNTVRQECMLVVKSLGYQIETKYIFGKTIEYIPWGSVDYVFINEAISLQRVLFILSMFTYKCKNNSTLIPLFMATKPRLQCLETIYQELNKL